MQRRSTTPGRVLLWRSPMRSAAVLGLTVFLALTLGACDFWPFTEDRKSGAAGEKKSALFDRSPTGCPTACAMASASKHELMLLFGSEELPAKLAWGRPYVDGSGFEQFAKCVGDDDSDRITACLQEGHRACIEACIEGETARIDRKGGRHEARDAARKRARNKPPPKGTRRQSP